MLEQLKALQEREGGTLGSLATRLLAEALALHARRAAPRELRWS